MVTIDFKLGVIKLESCEAYLLTLGEHLSWDFEVIYLCRKKSSFKYMPISQTFLNLQENK